MTVIPTPDDKNTAKHSAPKKPFKYKKFLTVVSVFLIFCIVLVSSFFILVKIGEIRLKNSLVANEKLETEAEDDFSTVYHNNKAYAYNDNLINLLLIGTDADKVSHEGQGQADALYLVSVDSNTDKVKILSISRNTMCYFNTLGIDGKAYGNKFGQICLSYAYANDDIKSSENCVNAVSALLYNIPINGYYTIRLDAIPILVDAVGGVEVTLTESDKDITENNSEYIFFIGKNGNVKLDGEAAEIYLGVRASSNAPRVERHKKFISAYITAAKKAVSNDLSLPFKLANKMKEYSVTDIDISSAVYLATEALNWQVEFINIKGEYGVLDEWETFIVDEKELKNTIIDNFYIEK